MKNLTSEVANFHCGGCESGKDVFKKYFDFIKSRSSSEQKKNRLNAGSGKHR